MSVDLSFRDYQEEARETIQWNADDPNAMIIPLLGLAGEAGQLLTQFKKWIRDGDDFRPFDYNVAEELGDLLWYISAIAVARGLSLDEIAAFNLGKCRQRWTRSSDETLFDLSLFRFDSEFPENEQLPTELTVKFVADVEDGLKVARIVVDGKVVGNELDDNSHADDGYRFHDALHLAFAFVLGWSPIMRDLLGRKRKSNAEIDRVEDGARARFLEEAISAMVFKYAEDQNFFANSNTVDYDILRAIGTITRGLEVRGRSFAQWERAILTGFKVWRELREHGEGEVRGNMATHTLEFVTEVHVRE